MGRQGPTPTPTITRRARSRTRARSPAIERQLAKTGSSVFATEASSSAAGPSRARRAAWGEPSRARPDRSSVRVENGHFSQAKRRFCVRGAQFSQASAAGGPRQQPVSATRRARCRAGSATRWLVQWRAVSRRAWASSTGLHHKAVVHPQTALPHPARPPACRR